MDVCCCGNTNLVIKHVKRRRKHDSSATYNKRWRRSSSGTGTNITLRIPRRSHNNFQDVVVCNPLTRRYVRMSPKTTFKGKYITHIYLGGRNVSIQDFKVLCLLQTSCEDAYDIACSECRYHVGVLCSNGSWREIGMGTRLMEIIGAPTEAFMYFYTGGREVITVDQRSGDVSTLILPDVAHWEARRHDLRPTGGYSDGVDRIVFPEDNGSLKVFVRMDGSRELVLDKVIDLSVVTRGLPWYTQRIDAGFGGGRTPRFVVGRPNESKWTFSIDVETLEVITFSD